MSLFIIFAKWLSVTFTDSLLNFTGIQSGPVVLWELNIELNRLFYLSGVVACGTLNFLFCVTDHLMSIILEWPW